MTRESPGLRAIFTLLATGAAAVSLAACERRTPPVPETTPPVTTPTTPPTSTTSPTPPPMSSTSPMPGSAPSGDMPGTSMPPASAASR